MIWKICLKSSTKQQENAFLGGTAIIMSMGFYIAWDSFLLLFPNQCTCNKLGTPGEQLHAILSWHVAFVIGAGMAAHAVRKWSKNRIYYVAGFLLIISGCLMIPAWSTLQPIIAARYIGGLAHGFAFLTVIIHSSEVAAPESRGRVTGGISLSLAMSLFLGFGTPAVLQYFDDSEWLADRLHAIMTVIFGILSLLATYKRFIESPVFHLEMKNSEVAMTCLTKLRQNGVEQINLSEEFAEMNAFANDGGSSCFFNSRNIIPLARAAILRSLYTLATLVAFCWYSDLSAITYVSEAGLRIVLAVRFFGEAAGVYFVDRKGRHKLLTISMAISAIFLLLVECLQFFSVTDAIIIVSAFSFLTYNLFLGLGLGPVSIVYLGESFSCKEKSLSIFFVLCVEHALQIFSICIFDQIDVQSKAVYVIVAAMQLAMSTIWCEHTAETNGLSLKGSKDALRDIR